MRPFYRRIWIWVLGGILLVVLAGVSLPFFFPNKFFNFFFSRALQDAAKSGIYIEVESLGMKTLELNLQIPRANFYIEKLKVDWAMKLFPPSLHLDYKHAPPSLSYQGLVVEAPNLHGDASYSLMGGWFLSLDAETKAIQVDGKKMFPALTLKSKTTGETLTLEAHSTYKNQPVMVSWSADVKTHPSLAGDGKMKAAWGEVKADGPLKLERVQDRVSIDSKPHFRWNDMTAPSALEVNFDVETFSAAAKFAGDVHLVPTVPLKLPEGSPKLDRLTGRIVVSGTARLTDGKYFVSTKVSSKGISGFFQTIPFKDAKFQLGLRLDKKGIFGGGQEFTLASIGKTLKLTDVTIVANGPKASKLTVSKLEGSLAKGKVTAVPFPIELDPFKTKAQLNITNADLNELVSALDLKSLSVKGNADATIPLSYRKNFLRISNAEAHALGGGVLIYKDASTAGIAQNISTLEEFQNLLARGQQALAFKALDNFHFSELSIKASRKRKSGLSLDVHLKGRNPDLAKGQPFELNLPITGKVEDLVVQSLLSSLAENEQWEDKIENIMDKRR